MSKENEFIPEDLEFGTLVKKAKRRSMIRMVLISLIISLIVLFGLKFLGDYILIRTMDKETSVDSNWNMIMGANVEEEGTTYHYSPLTAMTRTTIVKKVGGVPIPWGEREKVFSVFGTSRLLTTEGPSGSGIVGEDRLQLYYQGERTVEFFHPKVNYTKIFDDRELLNQMDENLLVEYAFSFDKAYTVKEIEQAFKDNIAWSWVDTFDKKVLEEENADQKKSPDTDTEHRIHGVEAYGFSYINHPDVNSADNFISTIQMMKKDGGEYQAQAKEFYNNMTDGGKKKLSTENLKIIGVVVTGKPSELRKYNDSPMVRAATLGATTDQY
jgi:Sigma factor regulator C-terminal/Sigma factor regulator N-terminal